LPTPAASLLQRIVAGSLLGLIGAALNTAPLELLPGMHLIAGPLAFGAAAVLFGPLAGLIAGVISSVATLPLWGHPWGLLNYGLEGLVLGWLARRMLPVVADLLWWIVGLPLLWLTYVVLTGIPGSHWTMLAVKQPLNSLIAVLAIQGLLLLPAVRRAVRPLIPPSLQVPGMTTSMATALAITAALPLLVLGAQEGRSRYNQEIREFSLRNHADAEVARVSIEESIDTVMRALVVLAEMLAAEGGSGDELVKPPHFEGRLRRILERTPELLNVHVGDARRHVLAFEPPLPLEELQQAERIFAEAAEIDRAMRTGTWVLTGFFLSRIVQPRPIAVLVVPVLRGGRVVGYASGAIAAYALIERASVHLDPTQRLVVIDDRLDAIIREAPGRHVLTTLRGTRFLQAIEAAQAQDGMGAWTPRESRVTTLRELSRERIAVAAIDPIGWRVVVTQPQAVAGARVRRAYFGLLVGVASALLLVLIASLIFVPAAVRPVQAISAAAARFAAGDRRARAGPATADAARELQQLGEDFDRMAEEITLQFEAVEAASRAKDEFLSIASHELKTPLTALKTQVQLLRRRLPREQAEALRKLDRQVDRLTRLVNQLLDASRAGIEQVPLEPHRCDLAEIARNVAVGLVRAERGHELHLDLEEAVGTWDELRLEQVVHNLVANAVKYSPEGGPIEIRVRRRPDGWAELTVADRGLGLAEGRRDLFERFTRGVEGEEGVNLSGLGVGLYVARAIVMRHGGTISLVPREGGGAVATVALPPEIPAPPPE